MRLEDDRWNRAGRVGSVIEFEIDGLTPCLKDSNTGETLECDPLQEMVDKYVEENSPYGLLF